MDMRKHGTMQDGERSITAKLTESEVIDIIKQVKSGPRGTQRKLAARYGISIGQMSRIVNGKRWAYLHVK